ncbi:MAG: polysaccharide deacetylase family protein [Planctomycetes bacterium]|nr:polysaccharide deacetylase family protein [Planctomycetota bacterium]
MNTNAVFEIETPRGDPDEQPKCLAVMYHYVHDEILPLSEGVRGLGAAEFEAQLDELCAWGEPINWPSLYAWRQGRGAIPERCFLLTFDDGLGDHARVVVPILEERNLRGVFFVPGAVLSEQQLLSAHAIHVLLATLGTQRFADVLTAHLAHSTGRTDWFAGIDAAAALAMYHYESPERARLKYLLTSVLPVEVRRRAVFDLFEHHVGSATRWAKHWYLGWDELMAMHSHGHTIGGHGYRHEPYSRLSPMEQCTDALRAARILEAGLGPEVRPFSYPYGRYDDDAARACRDAGFVHAFTTQSRYISDSDEPMAMPRVDTIHVDAVIEEQLECRQP